MALRLNAPGLSWSLGGSLSNADANNATCPKHRMAQTVELLLPNCNMELQSALRHNISSKANTSIQLIGAVTSLHG